MRSIHPSGVFILAVALCLPLLGAGPSRAWEATAGWSRADVGLHADGDGIFLGLAGRTALTAASRFDLVYALEYVQKAGAQPTLFSDPVAGIVTTDAEVTLHCLQPAALLELKQPGRPYLPRIYAGLSVALKVSEAWSDFPGTPAVAYGYEDIDWVAHLGLVQRVGPAALELRYSAGLAGQLLEDPTGNVGPVGPAKADDPLPGVATPVPGTKLRSFQLGVRVGF